MDKIIFDNHQKWIKIATTFGAGDYAEDLVQDTYLKCLEVERVNEAYFYFALRNTVVDWHRKEKKEFLYVNNEQFLNEQIYNYIDTWHHYDRKLYLTYIENKLSMRDISEQTNISLTSIFKTIKNCNEKLRVFINEQYEL